MKTNTVNTMDVKFEEMILKDIKGENGSSLTISPVVIEELKEKGYIVEVGRKNDNVYFEIICDWMGSLRGKILMHIKNNKYQIFDRIIFIQSDDDFESFVDVISLLKMSFSIHGTTKSKNRELAMANVKKEDNSGQATVYLHRALMSIALYGEIRSLDSSYDVHHKGACFDNRQDMMMYIPRAEHKHKTSHITGGKIESIDMFMSFMGTLDFQYDNLKNCNKIA